MKDPIKIREVNTRILIALFSIILLTVSLGFIIYDVRLEKRAVNITAQIKSINVIEGKNKANVAFRLTGHDYEALITLKNNQNVAVDDKITVKVDMYNPSKEIINNHYYIYVPSLILAIILIILSYPYLYKHFKLKSYREELKKNGFFVNATITAVFINNNEKLKRHKQLPFRLRAKYFNPMTKSEYVFESDDTYVDINDPINEYKKTTVVVYLNQSDLTKYYVDLDSLYPPLNIVDPIALMGPKTEIKFNFHTRKKDENKEGTNDEPAPSKIGAPKMQTTEETKK